MPDYRIKIGQLPEERIGASNPREAARKVAVLLQENDALARLADDAPVQLKHPDGRVWGRNLTIADYRSGIADADTDDSGPVRPAVP